MHTLDVSDDDSFHASKVLKQNIKFKMNNVNWKLDVKIYIVQSNKIIHHCTKKGFNKSSQ